MKEDMEKRQPKINDIKNTRANTAHSTEQINRVNDINKDRVSSTGMQSFQQGYNALGGNNFSRSNLNRKMPVSNSQSIGNVSNSRNKLKNQRNNNSNLKTGSSNKDPNSIPRALQNKNNNRILNRISRGISPSFDNNQEQQNEGNDVFEEDNELDISNNDVAVNKNVLVIVKMLPVLLPIAAIVILLIFVVALFSDPISVTSSFAGIETHDSSNPSYAYDESNPEGLAAEKEYNNKLFETIDFYRNNYNVNLDKYLLHAAVSYRYYGENIDDLYLSDSGVSKEDLENILLEKNLTNFDIEYTDYTRKIGVVAALMVNENNGSYISNSERYGIFYTNLMESEFLTSYYSEFLQNDSITSKQKLVDDIFDFYEYAKGLLTNNKNGGLVFDGMKVYLQTCAYDTSYNYKEINGLKVYDNPLTSEGTSYPSYLSMTDYVKGVLMGEIGDYIKEENKEGLKVMATVALSYIIRDDNSGFDLRSEELYFPTGNCRQVACDPNNGCTYIKGKTVGKYGTAFVGVGRFGNEGGQHYPLSESKQQILNEVLSDVFGNILVKKGVTSETFTGSRDMAAIQHYSDLEQDDCEAGRCFGQTNVLEDARNGMT